MIVIRDVFQAKYGKGGELVQLFKEVRQALRRIATSHELARNHGKMSTVAQLSERWMAVG
jgi:hypothetical protein